MLVLAQIVKYLSAYPVLDEHVEHFPLKRNGKKKMAVLGAVYTGV